MLGSIVLSRGLKKSTRRVEMVMLLSYGGLGKRGEIVAVKPGFARNFLYPKHIATYATDENIARFVLPSLHMMQLEKLQGKTINK